jgi:replicative DNA helicase
VIAGMTEKETIFWRGLSELNADCFYHHGHRKIFEMFVSEKRHDYPLITKALEGIDSLGIEDIICHPWSVRGDTEFALVLEAYRRREGIRFCNNAINDLFSDPDRPAVETMSEAIIGLNSVQCGSEKEVYHISELIPAEFDRIERLSKGESVSFIKTGFAAIDKTVSIQQHDYVLVGARPSNCKSTFAASIARNVCLTTKKLVLYFCLDASKRREVSRNVFTVAGISLAQFNLGYTVKRDLPKIEQSAEILSKLPLYFDDTPGTTAIQITAKAQRLKHEVGDIGLVVVDFLQNVFSRQRTEREKVNETSSILHNLPRIIGCPVIALSQMARYDGEVVAPPKLSNLKESGNLEADADVAFLLWYSDFYNRHRDDKQKATCAKFSSKLMVDIAKYKDGSVGFQMLNFEPTITRLSDLSESESEGW